MKRTIFLLLFFLPTSIVFAQKEAPTIPFDSITGKINYMDVVQVEYATKTELYFRSKEWFEKLFNPLHNVVQLDDMNEGKIMIKYSFKVYEKILGIPTESGEMFFTLAVFVRDGRYKYEITNFNHVGKPDSNGKRLSFGDAEQFLPTHSTYKYFKNRNNFFLSQIDNMSNALIKDMKIKMSKPSIRSQKDNW